MINILSMINIKQVYLLSEVATALNIKGLTVNLTFTEQLSCPNCLIIVNQLAHFVPG